MWQNTEFDINARLRSLEKEADHIRNRPIDSFTHTDGSGESKVFERWKHKLSALRFNGRAVRAVLLFRRTEAR